MSLKTSSFQGSTTALEWPQQNETGQDVPITNTLAVRKSQTRQAGQARVSTLGAPGRVVAASYRCSVGFLLDHAR